MKRILTTYAPVCLLTGSLLYTAMPAVIASPAQSASRTAAHQDIPHTPTPVRSRSADAHQVPAKSSPELSVAKTPKKDASGKRFWGRIMDHFREIHSAEQKPK